ncbi:lipopolysaccharide biosynthesis protein [Psychroserpens sp. NJDZ02]|uniref:lipopolysaccharide biosynthesis protein n=1 Tax=Psychroserpens sp. NJDZ02 TaxID=2570561 RepID=UPI0014562A5D|nr:lipopolysaccharide biosynthesis protein [Psychroserpens sp. NJDZ02]
MNSNKILKNVLTLLSGTALAQAIPVLISPILTRIYSPSEIGVYTIFFATVNILAILSTGRLELAILIPKHKKDSYSILKLSLAFSVIISAISLLILLLFKKSIGNILGLQSISNWILIIPLTSLFLAAFQTYNYWLNRNDIYFAISKGKVLQGVIMGFIQVTCSILGSLGLLLGRVLSVILSSLFLVFTSRKKSPKLLPINKNELKNSLRENKDFPLYTMPNAVLNSFSNNLPLYLLENLFSAKITGFYSWSVRIIQAPMGMIIGSIQQVFYREASKKHNEKESLYSITFKTAKYLFFIGLIPYIFIYFFAPQIFAFVFGEKWRVAGEYTKYLIPWFFLVFINSPISSLVLILGKQKPYFIYELFLFIFRGIALYLGYRLYNDPKYSIIFYGIVGFVFNFILLFILLNLSKNSNKFK